MSKETKIASDGNMRTTSGEMIKVENSQLKMGKVKEPVLPPPNADGTRNRRGTANTSAAALVDRETGEVLLTRTLPEALPTTKLSSEFDDDTFNELDSLYIRGAEGTINFKILGWARYKVADSRCGTVVVLYTNPGMLQLDGVDMQFNEGVAGAFSRAGFKVTSLRRGRRSEDPDGHGLLTTTDVIGKFRYLSDKNLDLSQLSCGDDRPTIKGPFMPGPDGSNPQDIAYRQTVLQVSECQTASEIAPCATKPSTALFRRVRASANL